MKISILSANPLETKFNNVICIEPKLNDNSDVVIVNSDDYFDDKIFDQLRRLKRKYQAVFVLAFNKPDLLAYNKQYIDFCFDNNINLLDYDADKLSLDQYIEENISFTENYTKFAKYYLSLQPEIDYSLWFDNIDFANKHVLDLGCGMPNYLQDLSPKTYTGIDLSPQMIELAKQRYPEYSFEVGDITSFKHQCDAIISILDVINYLDDFETVKAVLRNCYDNLNDNGVLVFDVHNRSVLRTFKDYFDYEEDDEEQFIWESSVDHHKITHYFQVIDRDYKLSIEKHYQTYYDIDLITKYLNELGFTNIEVQNGYNHHIIKAKKEEHNE